MTDVVLTLKEAAEFLSLKPADVKAAIEAGVTLPKSGTALRLVATRVSGEYYLEESAVDDFLSRFDAEEPGRHPPVRVQRELLVEASHRCVVCDSAGPLEFQHIVEFARLKHHDPTHMIAACPSCHRRMTLGQIDEHSQREYKRRAQERHRLFSSLSDALRADGPIRFSWQELREVILGFRSAINAAGTDASAYDFSEVNLAKKNELNRMGAEYFRTMRQHHEPHFGKVRSFLADPVNVDITETYHEIVDELRFKIAAGRDQFAAFESVLLRFAELAVGSTETALSKNRRTLLLLLSFMYFQCDIGVKA